MPHRKLGLLSLLLAKTSLRSSSFLSLDVGTPDGSSLSFVVDERGKRKVNFREPLETLPS